VILASLAQQTRHLPLSVEAVERGLDLLHWSALVVFAMDQKQRRLDMVNIRERGVAPEACIILVGRHAYDTGPASSMIQLADFPVQCQGTRLGRLGMDEV